MSIRKSLGLTATEMAAKLSISYYAVRAYERGDRPISGPVAQLARILEEREGTVLPP